jgi:hypothetical protein
VKKTKQNKWGMLKKAIVTELDNGGSYKNKTEIENLVNNMIKDDSDIQIYNEEENIKMMNFWNDLNIPTPPGFVPKNLEKSPEFDNCGMIIDNNMDDVKNEVISRFSVYAPPPVPTYESDFDRDSKAISLIVNKIPIDIVKNEKIKLNLRISKENEKNAQVYIYLFTYIHTYIDIYMHKYIYIYTYLSCLRIL